MPARAASPTTRKKASAEKIAAENGPANKGPAENGPAATPERAGPERVAPEKMALELEQLVTYRVSLLAKLLERRLAKLVGQFDLAVAEYRVLGQIAMRPGCTVREISARTLVDKAQVSRSIAALERRELVTRSVPSSDRRSPVLYATRSGRSLIRRVAPLRQQQEREILADMPAADVADLDHTLRELFDRLNDATPVTTGEPARPAPARSRPPRARANDLAD